ncbi:MAG: substrate-binding domain-containing protein [Myxococcota bacterium]
MVASRQRWLDDQVKGAPARRALLALESPVAMYRRQFIAAATFLAACRNETSSSSPAGDFKVAVIPKGTTHEFWKAVRSGAERAGREQRVEVVWKGPLKEDDLKQQIDLVQSFVAQGVHGIVLAPLNETALQRAVKDATRAKIPVVVIDSSLAGSDHKAFVATDNLAAGKLAGTHIVRDLLPEGGKVVVLRYQEGSASTTKREDGCLEALKQGSRIEVVSDNQYAGATTESALSTAERLLLAQKSAEGGVQAIFAPNESTTFGVLLALRKLDLVRRVKLVGFDASKKLLEGLDQGEVAALVVQDPQRMGYLGVTTMVDHLRGKDIKATIDTGSTLVTAKNRGDDEVKALLQPG